MVVPVFFGDKEVGLFHGPTLKFLPSIAGPHRAFLPSKRRPEVSRSKRWILWAGACHGGGGTVEQVASRGMGEHKRGFGDDINVVVLKHNPGPWALWIVLFGGRRGEFSLRI